MTTEALRDVEHSLVGSIAACFAAGMQNGRSAQMTLDRFQEIPADGDLGERFVEIFRGAWGFDERQAEIFRCWPVEQLRLLHSTVLQAATLRAAGRDVRCRVNALVGLPRSVTVTLDESGGIQITFVGPELA
jgi:hypothetical protein